MQKDRNRICNVSPQLSVHRNFKETLIKSEKLPHLLSFQFFPGDGLALAYKRRKTTKGNLVTDNFFISVHQDSSWCHAFSILCFSLPLIGLPISTDWLGMFPRFSGQVRAKVECLNRTWMYAAVRESGYFQVYLKVYCQVAHRFPSLFRWRVPSKVSFPMLITNPEDEHEISGPALFRFLLNEETLEEF